MSRTARHLAKSVVYLYPSLADAELGVKAGGTGFLVFYPFREGSTIGTVYLVTAGHCIRRCHDAPVVRVNTKVGAATILETKAEDWWLHDDADIALGRPVWLDQTRHDTMPVPLDWFLTPEKVERWGIGTGDEILMIGRFVSQEGRDCNLPVARFGRISAEARDDERIPMPPLLDQVAYLVEMRSRAGFSGSPVFFPGERMWISETEPPTTPLLIGVNIGHIPEVVEVRGGNTPDATETGEYVQVDTGMAVVVPAWMIRGLLERGDIAKGRGRTEEYVVDRLKQAGHRAPDDRELLSELSVTEEEFWRALADPPEEGASSSQEPDPP